MNAYAMVEVLSRFMCITDAVQCSWVTALFHQVLEQATHKGSIPTQRPFFIKSHF